MKRGQILAVCLSQNKGERKRNIAQGELLSNWGLKNDAHAGGGHRQLSLLAQESIDKMVAMGLKVGAGDFAENLTTEGVDLMSLPIGSRLRIGQTILLEITQIGKECHNRCAIYHQAGDCVMPKEGVFAVIKSGGTVSAETPSPSSATERNRAAMPPSTFEWEELISVLFLTAQFLPSSLWPTIEDTFAISYA